LKKEPINACAPADAAFLPPPPFGAPVAVAVKKGKNLVKDDARVWVKAVG